jgi:hypothetical protein
MDKALLESTHGFEQRDPRWHGAVECAASIDEVVGLTRDYVATITPERMAQLPEMCRALRVKAEDDIDYWTLKLSQRHAFPAQPRIDDELMQDIFDHFLHASLRISQIHRRTVAEFH